MGDGRRSGNNLCAVKVYAKNKLERKERADGCRKRAVTAMVCIRNDCVSLNSEFFLLLLVRGNYILHAKVTLRTHASAR